MSGKKQEQITNEEYERAFQEIAMFLFQQYKKYKQDKLTEIAKVA